MRPRLFKIIENDWPTLFSVLGLPIIWAIAFLFPYIRKGGVFDPILAVAGSVLCIIIFLWRVYRIYRLFIHGAEVPGVLLELYIVKDRGRFEYTYQVNEETISTWCPIHKSKHVLGFRQGQPLKVLYDPNKPRHSIVQDLFVKN